MQGMSHELTSEAHRYFWLRVFLVADSLALMEDGSVWAWGKNLDGQLGISGQAQDRTRAVQSSRARQASGRPDPFRC